MTYHLDRRVLGAVRRRRSQQFLLHNNVVNAIVDAPNGHRIDGLTRQAALEEGVADDDDQQTEDAPVQTNDLIKTGGYRWYVSIVGAIKHR